eukprot:4840052-Prymnesium_polylepis.1
MDLVSALQGAPSRSACRTEQTNKQTNKPPRGHVGRRHTRQTRARQRDNQPQTDTNAEGRRYQAASASPSSPRIPL